MYDTRLVGSQQPLFLRTSFVYIAYEFQPERGGGYACMHMPHLVDSENQL